jgi:hypothetical protein
LNKAVESEGSSRRTPQPKHLITLFKVDPEAQWPLTNSKDDDYAQASVGPGLLGHWPGQQMEAVPGALKHWLGSPEVGSHGGLPPVADPEALVAIGVPGDPVAGEGPPHAAVGPGLPGHCPGQQMDWLPSALKHWFGVLESGSQVAKVGEGARVGPQTGFAPGVWGH